MTITASPVKDWTGGTLLTGAEDQLPAGMSGVNVVLNRRRLAEFMRDFAADADVRDFLLLDMLSQTAGLSISSTGLAEADGGLALRSFRIWEYSWLFKILSFRSGGMRVLDLGGPLSHIGFLAAIAGNEVLSLDIDERAIKAGNATAAALGLANYRAEVRDMRDLSPLADGSFHRVISCSVLEHLTADGQKEAVSEMARVLRLDGLIGLTFDYGPATPNANIYLPAPHEPPPSASVALERYVRSGLSIAGNCDLEDPGLGSLFRGSTASYTVASLFLTKDAANHVAVPQPTQEPSLMSNLKVPDLPGLIYGGAAFARQRRECDEAEKQAWVIRLNELEEAARERLAVLERVHHEAARGREEIAKQEFIIRKLNSALAVRDKWINRLRRFGIGRSA